MSFIARLRSAVGALVRPRQLGADVEEEMRLHIEMQAERLMRDQGLDAREARRQAAVAFGGVPQHKEDARQIRGVAWISGLSLDLRLGLRMLAKHRGLALIAGAGMAIAIAIATLAFGVISAFADPTLPFPGGERIVSIQNWSSRLSQPDRHALYDFGIWREKLTSIEQLGAARLVAQNLVDPAGRRDPVRAAEMSASGFRLTGTQPLLGRHLTELDEAQGAPLVAVIGYDIWQQRFNGEPNVIGTRAEIGGVMRTIVGVMPRAFAFPVNQNVWMPLSVSTVTAGPASGPEINVFGRLADGASVERAQAEVVTISATLAAQSPQTHAHLRAQVLPYTYPFVDLNDPAIAGWLRVLQGFVIVILVYVCANVAIVVYARTAARETEFVVRTALGASRARVVAQLVLEALVLSAAAAAAGIALATVALEKANVLDFGANGRPFWMTFGLSTGTVVYVTWLAVLAACIIGVIPALKVTGGDVQDRIRAIGAGAGGARPGVGRSWTFLIVAQIALAVTLLPIALFTFTATTRNAFAKAGVPAEEYVAATMFLDDVARRGAFASEDEARYDALHTALVRRLADEEFVAGVIVTQTIPGEAQRERVQLKDAPAPTNDLVGVSHIGLGYFDAFDVARVAGRDFRADDLTSSSARTVVVNRSFVRDVLGGRNALGRRVRLASADTKDTPWFDIVGVVDDLRYPDSDVPPAAVYFPRSPARYPLTVVIRTRGTVPSVASRLRAVAATVDPALRLDGIATLNEVREQEQLVWRIASFGISFLTACVLLLSAAGVYALMSFSVTRQRREIGIRTALGAQRGTMLWTVFSRAGAQVLGGLLVGLVVAMTVDQGLSGGELLRGHGPVLVPMAGLCMVIVGLLAALGPARRALGIQPVEALREQ